MGPRKFSERFAFDVHGGSDLDKEKTASGRLRFFRYQAASVAGFRRRWVMNPTPARKPGFDAQAIFLIICLRKGLIKGLRWSQIDNKLAQGMRRQFVVGADFKGK
jgi:hypothetical protein